jgi:carnitine 3-dehydrogenase
MKAGKACPASAAVLARLMPIAGAHAALPSPADAGRAIGRKP